MCNFCDTTFNGVLTQFGKTIDLKKTAMPTDMKDCQIIIHSNEPPTLVIFDRFRKAAFIEILHCPMCGRKLTETENNTEMKPIIHAHAIVDWCGDAECSNCGAYINTTEPYCQHCGADLDEPIEREN